jgi:hypothetical protein
VLPTEDYAQMVERWPSKDLFMFIASQGNKYALSELYHPREYRAFVQAQPVWREFHALVKSRAFVADVVSMLCDHDIDLALDVGARRPVAAAVRLTWRARVRNALQRVRRRVAEGRLRARFEFSMMPADGGHIVPHTDTTAKVISLVLPVFRAGEWDPAHGGGTAVVRPRDVTKSFNHVNRYMAFEDVETVATLPFEPNQCVVFVKTFNSWHAVHPMRGQGSAAMRQTLTIAIVRDV